MTEKQFLQAVSNGQVDLLAILLNLLGESNITYCVIGGLAVNAYVEPVVSLDLDIVITLKDIDFFLQKCSPHFKVTHFAHSINLSHPKSDLRIQLQTDARYQEFLHRVELREVLGYRMCVAPLIDLLQGKIWAYEDKQRRLSKRQKDLADILRLVEAFPQLRKHLPPVIDKIISAG